MLAGSTGPARIAPVIGPVLWLAAGLLAWTTARIVPAGRTTRWMGELAAAAIVAMACGIGATALDFGGWREADWRATLFAFLGALAAAGLYRLITLSPSAPLK
jgi:hypothetical protein